MIFIAYEQRLFMISPLSFIPCVVVSSLPSFLDVGVNSSFIICFCWWDMRFHLRAVLSCTEWVYHFFVCHFEDEEVMIHELSLAKVTKATQCKYSYSFFLVQWTIWAVSVIVVKMRWDDSALRTSTTAACQVCRRLDDGISHIEYVTVCLWRN